MSPSFGERVRLVQTGWDVSLLYDDSPQPPPAPVGNEVLLEVEAAGVCHRDLLDRAGRFPFLQVPITPGHEAAGRVVAVGPEVTSFRPGDRAGSMHRDACGECRRCARGETSVCEAAAWVLGLLRDGAYARHLLAPESAFYRLPADLPATQAAALHCTYGTAYRDLRTLGGLERGERVLITGANGGVGAAAVDIAARLGAEVVAVVRDERHRGWLERLGAGEVVVDAKGAFHEDARVGRVDLALDTVGSPTFHPALRSLAIGGRLVVVGNIVPERVQMNLGYVITHGLTIIGGSGATRRDMAELLALHAEAPFAAPIAAVMPLRAADEAQRRVRAGGLEGRIVLVPERDPDRTLR
jgi:D-arabinose 1-dehydrogenase-like Zn-dependent alcohol dehydrogenase